MRVGTWNRKAKKNTNSKTPDKTENGISAKYFVVRVHACLVFVLFFALCDWVVLLVKQNARGLYDFTERSFSPSIPKPVHGPLQACLNQPPSRVGAILGWVFLFFCLFFLLVWFCVFNHRNVTHGVCYRLFVCKSKMCLFNLKKRST